MVLTTLMTMNQQLQSSDRTLSTSNKNNNLQQGDKFHSHMEKDERNDDSLGNSTAELDKLVVVDGERTWSEFLASGLPVMTYSFTENPLAGQWNINLIWPTDKRFNVSWRGRFCFQLSIYRKHNNHSLSLIMCKLSSPFLIVSKPDVYLKKVKGLRSGGINMCTGETGDSWNSQTRRGRRAVSGKKKEKSKETTIENSSSPITKVIQVEKYLPNTPPASSSPQIELSPPQDVLPVPSTSSAPIPNVRVEENSLAKSLSSTPNVTSMRNMEAYSIQSPPVILERERNNTPLKKRITGEQQHYHLHHHYYHQQQQQQQLQSHYQLIPGDSVPRGMVSHNSAGARQRFASSLAKRQSGHTPQQHDVHPHKRTFDEMRTDGNVSQWSMDTGASDMSHFTGSLYAPSSSFASFVNMPISKVVMYGHQQNLSDNNGAQVTSSSDNKRQKVDSQHDAQS